MEARASPCGGAGWIAISQRFDECGADTDCADGPAGQARRQASRDFERCATTVVDFIRLAMIRMHAASPDQINRLLMNPNFLDRF